VEFGRLPHQQRVAIACALIGHPLLLDEPFSAVDAFTRGSLHEMLLSLWRELRPTILIVTLEVEEAVFLADRIVVIGPRPGRLHETMTIRLPRPRNKLTSEYDMARRDVLRTIDRSLASEKSTGLRSGAVSPWV
jgi:sulfonate transport system ATP-binding protein